VPRHDCKCNVGCGSNLTIGREVSIIVMFHHQAYMVRFAFQHALPAFRILTEIPSTCNSSRMFGVIEESMSISGIWSRLWRFLLEYG
jgi:hypothetical protein